MKYDLIIKNGTIVTSTATFEGDIGIKDERIACICKDLSGADAERIIDAAGRFVMPGGIDVHVHFELPFCGTVSADDFLSGSKAGAMGGVTTFIDYAGQDAEKGLMAGVNARMEAAREKVCIDYSLHCIINNWNNAIREEMDEVVKFGIPTFKMFMIYESEGWQSDDADLFAGLEATKENGARIMVHAESDKVMNYLIDRYLKIKDEVGAYGHTLSRPNFVEYEAVQRAITWTKATGGRLYIVHMSTGEAAEILHHARHHGVNVYAETCPQYLLLDDEVFKDPERGHLYACCPQVKKPKDQERLWKALAHEDVSIVSTDTCTFDTKQKDMWNGDFSKIPFGLPGIETLLPSVYTYGVQQGRFDLNHFVTLISTNPAKLMGLYPKKGELCAGADADVIIVDPKKSKTIDYKNLAHNCDWSPYQGMRMSGFPDFTICRGKVIVEDGEFAGKPGYGKFIKRKPFGEI